MNPAKEQDEKRFALASRRLNWYTWRMYSKTRRTNIPRAFFKYLSEKNVCARVGKLVIFSHLLSKGQLDLKENANIRKNTKSTIKLCESKV